MTMVKPVEVPKVRIKGQFRERASMSYDLDCSGTSITLRIFPPLTPESAEEWRIEARTSAAEDAVVATATRPTRTEAFDAVAKWWVAEADTHNLPLVDWDAIAKTMVAVRAL
ncbi:hypothetical protein BH09MYX1_BH09MYX1_58330 [soil metagenome]